RHVTNRIFLGELAHGRCKSCFPASLILAFQPTNLKPIDVGQALSIDDLRETLIRHQTPPRRPTAKVDWLRKGRPCYDCYGCYASAGRLGHDRACAAPDTLQQWSARSR